MIDADATAEERWIPWTGGGCPVAPDSLVTVKRRYGPVVIARAGDLRWSHDQYYEYGADDILAFRLEPLP